MDTGFFLAVVVGSLCHPLMSVLCSRCDFVQWEQI